MSPGISMSRIRGSPCGSVLPALWGPGADIFALFITSAFLAVLAMTWKTPPRTDQTSPWLWGAGNLLGDGNTYTLSLSLSPHPFPFLFLFPCSFQEMGEQLLGSR